MSNFLVIPIESMYACTSYAKCSFYVKFFNLVAKIIKSDLSKADLFTCLFFTPWLSSKVFAYIATVRGFYLRDVRSKTAEQKSFVLCGGGGGVESLR